ncbi:DoxX family protein [Saprospiraceae bacterium]|nr:DoxX family protein [Saprospiraceae bacterium]
MDLNITGAVINLIAITSIGTFWAILFLQSGLDKIFDWKGNLEWLTGHFAESPLASLVKPMLLLITIFELLSGAISGIGVAVFWIKEDGFLILLGLILSIISLTMLFFGQRVAKDYPGAQSIAIYFGIALLSLMFLK